MRCEELLSSKCSFFAKKIKVNFLLNTPVINDQSQENKKPVCKIIIITYFYWKDVNVVNKITIQYRF